MGEAKWTEVRRLPQNAVPITTKCLRGGTTIEQGWQAGRSRYLTIGYAGALNWFRVEKSSRKYPPLPSPTPQEEKP